MDDLVTVLLQHGHCLCPVDGQPLLDGLLLVVKVGPLLQSGHHLLGTDGQVDDPEHVNMDIKMSIWTPIPSPVYGVRALRWADHQSMGEIDAK